MLPSVTDNPAADLVLAAGGRVRAGRDNGLPIAAGATYRPCPGRRLWAVSYHCPGCGGVHLGRSEEPVASGPRRARCGRMVWLVVAGDAR